VRSPVSPEGSQLQFFSIPAVVVITGVVVVITGVVVVTTGVVVVITGVVVVITGVVVVITGVVVIGGSSQVSPSVHGCGTIVNLQASVFPPLKMKSWNLQASFQQFLKILSFKLPVSCN